MRPKYYPTNRQAQNEEIIPLSLKKPLELQRVIRGAGGGEKGQVCLYELSLLLTCFKSTSYSQVACAKEIGNFQKCYYSAKKLIRNDSKKEKQGKLTSKEEVNKLLEKYSV